MRLARPEVLVDVNRVRELDYVSAERGALRVGALVRQSSRELLQLPLLAECLVHVGHFATRNRGTVGGSVAHADASAELPVALAALGGTVVAASTRGLREIPASDFFVTHFTTTLEPDELLVETRWPADGCSTAFEEFALRRGDYALCMAAAAVRGDDVRVVVGSVGDRPTAVEVDPERPGESAAAQANPTEDLHASAAYRRQLVRILVDRAVERARAAA
jgi:CO/xanthine dehydrogenase FAD-binding subunit